MNPMHHTSSEISGSPADSSEGARESAAIPTSLMNFHPAHELRSPSLQKRSSCTTPAHELKLLVDESTAQKIEEALQSQLVVDPHAGSTPCGYSLTTLYCDTPERSVYLRQGRHRLFKFRLRRYDEGGMVYLERKSKQGLRVRKRRFTIPLSELGRFSDADRDTSWSADWYYRQLHRNTLRPVCILRYDRKAYFILGSEEPIRLTFDRNIQGALTNSWTLQLPDNAVRLLKDQVVCEFKYRGELPTFIKRLLESLQLTPRGVSKFRHCIEAHLDTAQDSIAHV